MKAITQKTRAEAWLAAVKHLVENEDRRDLNLVLEIKKPGITTPFSKLIEDEMDRYLKRANLYPLHTVAETIFPATEYRNHGKKGVFKIYPETIFPRIKSFNGNRNGTYAYRLVRGYDYKGEPCNPLEHCLIRMKDQIEKKGTKKSIYELSLDDTFSIPINRNDQKIMGFPCLSHISFKICSKNKLIHLTAIYRSQHYIAKALGNLLGLARLQGFIAHELEINIGVLVCHATDASLEHQKNFGKTVTNQLIKFCEENRIENQ